MRRFWAVSALAALAVLAGPAAGAAATSPQCKHWEGDPTTPCLVLTPAVGPVASHVRFHGTIPADQVRRYNDEWHSHPFYGLTGEFPASAQFPQGCELILPARGLKIALDTSTGVVRGSFTVGSRGTCSQNGGTSQTRTTYAARPGTYSLFIGSLSTYIATFRVTSGATAPPHKSSPPKRHMQPRSAPAPTRLPFTGPPILQMALFAGAVLFAGVSMNGFSAPGVRRGSPGHRRRGSRRAHRPRHAARAGSGI